MKKTTLAIGLISIFIISAISPIVFGNNIRVSNNRKMVKKFKIDSYHNQQLVGPPMDSAWPMYCHDVRHTGRSPYGKDGDYYIVKWKFTLPDADPIIDSSPAIDKNGTIYLGFQSSSPYDTFYAIYSNGTKKWSYDCDMVQSSPAIAEDGTVYVGSNDGRLYAFNPNGTRKWRVGVGDGWVFSSPVIDENGIIYVASVVGKNIRAFYPNGTVKWNFKTNDWIYDSPALDENGIVYIGSNDGYLYAIHKDNGSLKWKFKTGEGIGSAPTIGDDGIIYFSSCDTYLYALFPNGTLKWKFSVGFDAMTSSPALGEDGNIYFGCHAGYIYSLDSNGNENWRYPTYSSYFDAEVSAPVAIDNNGIIYAGDWGGTLYALNPDGTARWKFNTGDTIHCSPVIGEDGTIYIASWDGYLYALDIIEIDNKPPHKPTVEGPTNGRPRWKYKFKATTTDPDGDDVSYFFDWDYDYEVSGWTDFVPSGEPVSVKYIFYNKGTYNVKVRAQDEHGADSQWVTFQVRISYPRNKLFYNSLFLRFLEQSQYWKDY
jgi:outer membrane protein assembly factor BamB